MLLISAVGGISAAWDLLRGVVATPVNFVVRTVLRDGLFSAWNWVLDQMGIAGFHVDLRLAGFRGFKGSPVVAGPDRAKK
jgi:hypothetical protein